METIIIFTNSGRIYDLQEYILSWNTNDVQLKKNEVQPLKEIIIAHDRLLENDESINNLVSLVSEGSRFYLLRHTEPQIGHISILIDRLKLKACTIEGNKQKQHGDTEYNLIPKIDKYGVIEATKNLQELEKVFDELKGMLSGDQILEAKLELLHNCLVPKSVPSSLNSLLSSYNGAFSTFNNDIERSGETVFDDIYIEALTKFRNTLLDY